MAKSFIEKDYDKEIINIETTISSLPEQILELIFPVGSVFETMDTDFDPNETWVGTWERIKGKVLVGVDENDNDFNTVEKTGGSKTNNHYHTIPIFTQISSGIQFGQKQAWNMGNVAPSGVSGTYQAPTGSATSPNYLSLGGTPQASSYSANLINSYNNNISILQPYETCYIWTRVS